MMKKQANCAIESFAESGTGHPGTILRDLLSEKQITVSDAAAALKVNRQSLSELLNGHGGVSPEMAVRISKVFGMSAEIWLMRQLEYDLKRAREKLAGVSFQPFVKG